MTRAWDSIHRWKNKSSRQSYHIGLPDRLLGSWEGLQVRKGFRRIKKSDLKMSGEYGGRE